MAFLGWDALQWFVALDLAVLVGSSALAALTMRRLLASARARQRAEERLAADAPRERRAWRR